MKSWLEKNAIEIYSTQNKGKSVVAERFTRTLKNKIYKYMTSISKNAYSNKLDYLVNKYSNIYHKTIKIKLVDVNSTMYIDFDKENNKKSPKFKVAYRVRISKYKNIFAKGYVPNCSEEAFAIKKVKNTVSYTYVISDLKGKEVLGTFYEKELQKTNQKEFRVEKEIKRKDDKLYVKWKGYNNSFNSWIINKSVNISQNQNLQEGDLKLH